MRVAVCDDVEKHQDILIHNLLECMGREEPSVEIHIDRFSSGQEIVETHQRGKRYDIIFQDFYMEGMNGIDTIREIRKLDKNVFVVFVSGDPGASIDAYELDTADYVLKPIKKGRIDTTMKRIMKRMKERKVKEESFYVVENRNTIQSVRYMDVLYVKSEGKNTVLHCREEKITNYKRMKDIEETFIENDFIKINRSEMVNFDYIKKLDLNKVMLKSEESLFVSRRLVNTVNAEYSMKLIQKINS